ncbi:MAG: zinc ribbon domain-containing protein [Pyrinomonadaceae bacterium]
MFCPRCGQQAAEGIRFCSRCGLPLDAALEVVEAGGLPPARRQTDAEAGGGLTPRQVGTRKGLMLTAGGILSFCTVILLTAYKEDFFVLLVPAGILLVIGVMRMLYGLLLEEHAPARRLPKRDAADAAHELTAEPARGGELPPARAVPASAYARPGAQTSDMAAPPSVAEGTTRLLDEDEAGRRP